MHQAIHLVAKPNGNFVDPIKFQLIHNNRLMWHKEQLNRHRPEINVFFFCFLNKFQKLKTLFFL